ncbi:uncharacterized protein LOC108670463 [Hyalella azteca]|uniref:Uncharacterized protein LOC108670463 n=1 Tax=Hyalella azteca TaxID=294128 RepID=A0A8B7NJE4_HYAAZ|nr:uncharacterized protein LOC108670463 [Hyalella azteca]
MMKSVCLVLLLTAAFAYSGVEGTSGKQVVVKTSTSGCGKALNNMVASAYDTPNFVACKSDPEGSAAWTALSGNPACKDYKFTVGDQKCEVLAAPYMKCVAGKQGFLKDDGSIDSTSIIAKYKLWTSSPACDAAQFDFGVKKCGTTINNYAFLEKAACIATEAEKYTGQDKEKNTGQDKEKNTGHDKEKNTGQDKEKNTGQDKEKNTGQDKEKNTGQDKEKNTGQNKEKNTGQDKEKYTGLLFLVLMPSSACRL